MSSRDIGGPVNLTVGGFSANPAAIIIRRLPGENADRFRIVNLRRRYLCLGLFGCGRRSSHNDTFRRTATASKHDDYQTGEHSETANPALSVLRENQIRHLSKLVTNPASISVPTQPLTGVAEPRGLCRHLAINLYHYAVKILVQCALFIAVLTSAWNANATIVHVVVPGEQVGRLAAIYAVSAEEILAANPQIELPLEPGASVVIPDSATAETPPSALPTTATTQSAPPAATPVPIADPARTERSVAGAIQIPAAQGIRYNGRWLPPGETAAWVMDCSNTARWLVRETRGIEIPRTASSQYDWLKKNKRLWRVRPNAAALRKRLKPGDLLFWEHTYRPVRKPPVTHVMVYLGTDAQGRMLMAGSQGSRGVDTYTFDPTAKMGSYPFFLWFRRDGRFVAYGRP